MPYDIILRSLLLINFILETNSLQIADCIIASYFGQCEMKTNCSPGLHVVNNKQSPKTAA